MLTSKNQKKYLTLATLVTPYCERSIGKFCQWFSADNINKLRNTKTSVKVKFGDNEEVYLSENFLINTDRNKFDFSEWSSHLLERETDFVYLGAELEGAGRGFWNAVLARDKLNEIERNAKNGSRIQIFTIKFDNSLQRDNYLSISFISQQNLSLLFHSNRENLMGLGIIKNHRCMSVEKYEEFTGDDPILLFAKQNYYDPIYHTDYSKRMTFDDFLEQQRTCFV